MPRIDKNLLKARLDILTVAQDLGLQLKRGNMAHCYNQAAHGHGDGLPSLKFYKDGFKCYGGACDQGGDVFSLWQGATGVDFATAARELASQYAPDLLPNGEHPTPRPQKVRNQSSHDTLPVTPDIKGVATRGLEWRYGFREVYEALFFFNDSQGFPAVNETAQHYLKNRGLSSIYLFTTIDDYNGLSQYLMDRFGLETLQDAGLFNEKGRLIFWKHRLIAAFPDPDEPDRIAFLQGRSLDQSDRVKYLGLRHWDRLFVPSLDQVKKSAKVVICEGVFDTFSAFYLGTPAIGLTGVGKWKKNWDQLVKLTDGKKVVLGFDPDKAGRKATEALALAFAHRLGRAVSFLDLPGGKDLNDLLRSQDQVTAPLPSAPAPIKLLDNYLPSLPWKEKAEILLQSPGVQALKERFSCKVINVKQCKTV